MPLPQKLPQPEDGLKMTDSLRIECSHGFHYTVEVEYRPQHGSAQARYRGRRAADYCGHSITPPWGDSDFEHERYEELLGEWKDEADTHLKRACREYFDNDRQFE
jgi:hypothetical protein